MVIRRLLRGETGPTGGPAMTDLLGDCIGWGRGVATLRTEGGELVEIAIEDIVSGKPVPPRPSVRHRVSVADAEAHTVALSADLETSAIGDWTVRGERSPTGRLRRRLNSCLAVGDPGMPVADAADAVARHYAARSRPTYLHVELDGDHERALRALGWQPDPTGDAEFLLASIARVRRTLDVPDRTVEVSVDEHRVTVTVGDGCDPIAEGAAALDGDWLGVHGLRVDPAHRRRGLALVVMDALLEWGAERGATTAWLHVEVDNVPALALYDRLGFAGHHLMRYLTPPA